MTTPIVQPVLTVHKIFQTDTSDPLRPPLLQFFETLTEAFTMPAIAGYSSLLVIDTSRYAVGQFVWILGIGVLEIIAITDPTHMLLQNDGSYGNVFAGETVPIGSVMSISTPLAPGPNLGALALTDILAQQFVTPVGSNSVPMVVAGSGWYVANIQVYVKGAGWYKITSFDVGSNTLTVVNANFNNIAGGTTIVTGTPVWPMQSPFATADSYPAIQRGVVSAVTFTSSQVGTNLSDITFPIAFKAAPTVVLLSLGGANVQNLTVCVSAITASTFTINYSSTGGVTADVHWIAMA